MTVWKSMDLLNSHICLHVAGSHALIKSKIEYRISFILNCSFQERIAEMNNEINFPLVDSFDCY